MRMYFFVLMVMGAACSVLSAAEKDAVQPEEVWRLDDAQWQSKMESIREKSDALMQRYRLLLKEYRLLQQRLERQREDVLVLKHKVEQLNEDKTDLVREIELLKQKNVERRKEKDELEAKRLNLQRIRTRWEAALRELKEQQTRLEADLLRMQQAAFKSALVAQRTLQNNGHAREHNDGDDDRLDQEGDIDAVLAQWKMEEGMLQQEIEDIQRACEKLTLDIQKLEAEQKDLRARLADRAKRTDSLVQEWRATVTAKEEELQRWRQEVETLMHRMDALQQRMAAASEALHHKKVLMDEIARLDEENRRLRRELAEWDGRRDADARAPGESVPSIAPAPSP